MLSAERTGATARARQRPRNITAVAKGAGPTNRRKRSPVQLVEAVRTVAVGDAIAVDVDQLVDLVFQVRVITGSASNVVPWLIQIHRVERLESAGDCRPAVGTGS